MMHSIMEEELINIFLMVFLIPSGPFVKIAIHSSLYIWATMHVSELFKSILENNPNALGISALAGIIDYIIVSKVELAMLKNTIELTIGMICVPMVFLN